MLTSAFLECFGFSCVEAGDLPPGPVETILRCPLLIFSVLDPGLEVLKLALCFTDPVAMDLGVTLCQRRLGMFKGNAPVSLLAAEPIEAVIVTAVVLGSLFSV